MDLPIDPTASAQANYAVQLRWFRQLHKMTQSKLGEHPEVMVSGKTIEAVENMRRPPTRRLSIGVDNVFKTDLFKGVYASYLRESGLPPGFVEYAEREENASRIKIYSQHYLSGLVQTESCAREILSVGHRKDRLEEAVAARLARQEILRRESPPEITCLIEEGVIRKLVAVDRKIASEQIQYLLTLSEESDVSTLIVPLSAHAYPESAFSLLSFDNEPDIGYLEGARGLGNTLKPGPQVTELAIMFDRIRGVGLTAPDSLTWLRSVMEEL